MTNDQSSKWLAKYFLGLLKAEQLKTEDEFCSMIDNLERKALENIIRRASEGEVDAVEWLERNNLCKLSCTDDATKNFSPFKRS